MRYLLIIWMMAFLCGCAGKDTDNEVLQIDLNAKHSSIRLNLKDIADVTYIKLASNTDFLVRSRALVCNENYILTKGGGTGEILMFDREGQPVRKFSHYGNGPHEYNYITNLRVDEKRGEIYVHDVFSRKIVVYDLNGEYIRELASGDARFIYNFNDDAFLVYNTETNRVNSDLKPYFSILAKNDGEIQKKIDIPFSSGKKYDLTVTKEGDGGHFSYTAMHLPVVRNSEGYILNELSSDTIYQYSYDGVLTPVMLRTPAISSMSAPVFLQYGIETSKYVFLTWISVDESNERDMFPEINWVYNKENGDINEYEIRNDDYPDAKIVLSSHLVNCDMQSGYGISRFNADELLEAYQEGKLYGELKDLASSLKDEDNDVLILYKFK